MRKALLVCSTFLLLALNGCEKRLGALAGDWRAVTNIKGHRVVTVLALKADGTFTVEARGPGYVSDSGRYMYKDGVLTLNHRKLGIEKDSITWISDDSFRAKCFESDLVDLDPSPVSLELTYERQK